MWILAFMPLLFFSYVNATVYKNRTIIDQSVAIYNKQWTIANNSNHRLNNEWTSTVHIPAGDTGFTESVFAYCVNCFDVQTMARVTFGFVFSGSTNIRMTLVVNSIDPLDSIKLYNGEKSNNFLEVVANQTGAVVMVTSGSTLLMRITRVPQRTQPLNFGFHAAGVLLRKREKNKDGGCVLLAHPPLNIPFPTHFFGNRVESECWTYVVSLKNQMKVTLPPCIPEDDDCHLLYVRLYDSSALGKTRINPINDSTTLTYQVNKGKVIVEYYGCPVKRNISISVKAIPEGTSQ